MRRLEEPCGIPSAPALLQLSRFAARNVKVVLSGQGADEPHGGYGRHQAAAALGPAARLGPLARPLQSRGPAAGAGQRARPARAPGCSGPMSAAQRLVRLVEITDEDVRAGLVGSAGDEAAAERHRARAATCSATWATAAWSSRRSTSTPACSCRTAC